MDLEFPCYIFMHLSTVSVTYLRPPDPATTTARSIPASNDTILVLLFHYSYYYPRSKSVIPFLVIAS